MIDLALHGSRPMICVAVTYIIKSGHEGRAVELFRELTGPTRGEPGGGLSLVPRSTPARRNFFLYEQYDDQPALDAPRASEHFARHATGGLFPIIESRTPE